MIRGWHEYTGGWTNKEIAVGEKAYLSSVDGISFAAYFPTIGAGSTYTFSVGEEGMVNFQPLPDGELLIQTEVAALMRQFEEAAAEAESLTTSLASFNPHVGIAGDVEVVFYERLPYEIPQFLLSADDPPRDLSFVGASTYWSRTRKQELRLSQYLSTSTTHNCGTRDAKAVLWENKENLQIVQQEREVLKHWQDIYKVYHDRYHAYYNQAGKAFLQALEYAAYQEFLQEFGDPDLWEGHKKAENLQFDARLPEPVRNALKWYVERNLNVVGQSVRSLLVGTGGSMKDVPALILDYVIKEIE